MLPPLRCRRILLVSGDYDACDALSSALTACGFTVDAAYDAATALELAAQQPYGLALLDHWPPYLDAFRCFRRLRRLATSLPAVILDDAAPDREIEAALAGGLHAVLPRSLETGALVSMTEELLEQTCAVSVA